MKNFIKEFLNISLGSNAVFKLSKKVYLDSLFPYIQAVTYHDTPQEVYVNLKSQMQWYKENYVNCNLSDLQGLLADGVWTHSKPGLIISFDDGLRSNFEVAIPLLEEYGFTGWLMIPAGFADTDPAQQVEFAKRSLIQFCPSPSCERIAMSWAELHDAERRGHIATCHSMSHKRLSAKLTEPDRVTEIKAAKKLMESRLGHSVDLFAWVGGEEWAYSRTAFDVMKEVGFKYIFCTNCSPIVAKQSPLFLQRYHIDPNFNVRQLRFVLGGFYDLLYMWKRRRVSEALNEPLEKSHEYRT